MISKGTNRSDRMTLPRDVWISGVIGGHFRQVVHTIRARVWGKLVKKTGPLNGELCAQRVRVVLKLERLSDAKPLADVNKICIESRKFIAKYRSSTSIATAREMARLFRFLSSLIITTWTRRKKRAANFIIWFLSAQHFHQIFFHQQR